MKVVHISTNDIAGGAARSAYRLHQGLRNLGCDSKMFVKNSRAVDSDIIELKPSTDITSRLLRRVSRDTINHKTKKYHKTTPPGCEAFSACQSPFWDDFISQLPKCALINIHWVADMFIDYRKFFTNLPRDVNVVWTLHDMNPLTGGCHYNMGCEQYRTECGSCPQLGSSKFHDLANKYWHEKSIAFAHAPDDLHFVAPSRWLANEVRMSPLTNRFVTSIIPYGLDLEEFAPRDKRSCRQVLGIPVDSKVVLFVADGLSNSRKGFSSLLESLEKAVKELPIVLVSVGGNKPETQIETKWIHVGSVANDRLLSMIYSAVDLFVIPSLQDNLPNTVLESLACGTPVLGYDVGGIPDMIKPGINGMLVPPNNPNALSQAMVELLSSPDTLVSMSLSARSIALNDYGEAVQAKQYLDLYNDLMKVNA